MRCRRSPRASAAELANDTSDDTTGASVIDDIQSTSTGLASSLGDAYNTLYEQIGKLGDILVTDWGKLRTAGLNAAGPWAWTSTDADHARDALTLALDKLVYEALFPLAYVTYGFGDREPSDARDYLCQGLTINTRDGPIPVQFHPFQGQANGAGYEQPIGAGPQTRLVVHGNQNSDFLLADNDIRADSPPGPVPQSLFDSTFTNPAANAPSIPAPPLPSQLRFDVEVYAANRNITHNSQGWCSAASSVSALVPAPQARVGPRSTDAPEWPGSPSSRSRETSTKR